MISLHEHTGRYRGEQRSLWLGVGPGVGYGISDDVQGQVRSDNSPWFGQALATTDACVRVIEGYFQEAPMSIQRMVNDKLQRVKGHPLAHLVEVSPDGISTATEWIGILAQEFERTGNAMGIIRRDGQYILAIEPFTRADATLTKDGNYYIWQIGSETFTWNPAEEMPPIFHAAQNKLAPRRPIAVDCQHMFGVSPVRAARLEMEVNLHGMEYFRDSMYLGGRGQIAIVDGSPADQTDQTLDAASKRLTETLSNPSNRGTVSVFPKDTQVVQLAQDADFLDKMRYSDEKLAALYKVPLLFINNMERATYDNITTIVEYFVTRTMQNKYNIFEAAFKRQVIGYRGVFKNLYMKFMTAELLKADPIKHAQRVKTFAALGAYKIDELREQEGTLDPVGGELGEQRYILGKPTLVKTKEEMDKEAADKAAAKASISTKPEEGASESAEQNGSEHDTKPGEE